MIYLCLAHMSEQGWEQKYVKEAFDTNWVVPLGPNVNAFEKDLEAFVGEDKQVVALSSGTAAVHLALIGSGIVAGDEVCVNFDTGLITNRTTGKTYQAAPFPPFMQKIIASGGLVNYSREKIAGSAN